MILTSFNLQALVFYLAFVFLFYFVCFFIIYKLGLDKKIKRIALRNQTSEKVVLIGFYLFYFLLISLFLMGAFQ